MQGYCNKCDARYSSDSLKIELNAVPFICIFTDASNHKDIKLFPTLIRYPATGINGRMLDLMHLPGETAVIIYDSLMDILEKHNLKEKVVGFCADKANTNFGGVEREVQSNIFRKLQEGLERLRSTYRTTLYKQQQICYQWA